MESLELRSTADCCRSSGRASFIQRRVSSDSRPVSSDAEERQLGLAIAAEDLEVDLDAADAA